MDNIKDLLAEDFKDKEARRQYAVDFLNSHIALQIKTLRQQRGWSQVQLAKLARKHQSQISAMESVDFSAWKISTLLKLAEAFDLALTVNFESFGGFLDYLTSIDREALERPSFADDPALQPGEHGTNQAGSSQPEAPHSQQLLSSSSGDSVVYIDKFLARRAGASESPPHEKTVVLTEMEDYG